MSEEIVTAWMTFAGKCLDGPWKGHHIESEVPTVYTSSEQGTYYYGYSKVAGGWYWVSADGQSVDGEVKS